MSTKFRRAGVAVLCLLVRAAVVHAQPTQLEPPAVSPAGGVYQSGLVVSLQGPVGAQVRYTTNGLEPDQSSPLYTTPVAIQGAVTLRAAAFQSGWTPSAVVVHSYTIDDTPPEIVPTVYPPPNGAGWNKSSVRVSFWCGYASAVANCPVPIDVVSDGAAQLVSVSASDAAGNIGSAQVTVNIDRVAPTLTNGDARKRRDDYRGNIPFVPMACDLGTVRRAEAR